MKYIQMGGDEEIWQDLYGYKGYFQVSNLGNIRSLDRTIKPKGNQKSRFVKGKQYRVWKNYKGYCLVTLAKHNVKKAKVLHILIAKTFIPNPCKRPEVNHKNGIKDDNRACNLEWNTRLQNQHHSINVLGKLAKGESHVLSKLTEQDVINIINLHKTGKYTYVDIARMYNMEETQMARIIKRKSWKHLKIA